MFYIKQFCPICKTGTIGFRFCEGENRIILMCDECDTVWNSPDNISVCHALFLTPPGFCISGTNCCLIASHWATREEIKKQDWAAYVYSETEGLVD